MEVPCIGSSEPNAFDFDSGFVVLTQSIFIVGIFLDVHFDIMPMYCRRIFYMCIIFQFNRTEMLNRLSMYADFNISLNSIWHKINKKTPSIITHACNGWMIHYT